MSGIIPWEQPTPDDYNPKNKRPDSIDHLLKPLKDSDAIFSDCRKHRYALWRIWNYPVAFTDDLDKPYLIYYFPQPS